MEQSEKLTPEAKTLIPRDVIRALGRGIRQSLAPHTQVIGEELQKDVSITDDKDKTRISDMQNALDKTNGFIDDLETAEQVFIVPFYTGSSNLFGLYDFEFSSEKTAKDTPEADTIDIDAATTAKLRRALNHNLNNTLGKITGHSQLLSFNADSDIANLGEIILSNADHIQERLKPILNAETINITTDDLGNTRIRTTPLQPKKEKE